MKIIAMVHGYPPDHNAGAEWMLHEMMKYMVSRGHSVDVLLPISGLKPYEFEGVKVRKYEFEDAMELTKRADVVLSHLERTGKGLNFAEHFKKPFVYVVHNSNYLDIITRKHRDTPAQRWVYCIYNSQFTKDANAHPNPYCIVHPPIDYKRYHVSHGTKIQPVKEVKSGRKKTISVESSLPANEHITLINLFWRKGGVFFHELARQLPEYKFLGVKGMYGKQEESDLKNVTYMENTPNIKQVYAKTRILLMPSVYESYGRTGIEAMCSGIPVIACPTPGLKESLGDAGIFCEEGDHAAWIDAIKKLDDPAEYERVSKKCLERSANIESLVNKELENMEQFFNDVINKRL